MPEISRQEWNSFFCSHPDASFLQSPAWGDVKAAFGWDVVRFQQGDSGAQMLIKRGPLGIKLGYVPKGPLGTMTPQLLTDLLTSASNRKCFVVTVEQDSWDADVDQVRVGFETKSGKNIQPQRTIVITLVGSENDWLTRMKQKTRYNIRLAQKKDVKVEETADIGLFFNLMRATGARDEFGIHTRAYYQKVFDSFHPQGECVVLLATFNDQPLGAIMVLSHGSRAWYVYGASNDLERNRMPTYLLQWEGMRWAAGKGCKTYDLWGIPDEEEDVLEAQLESRSDGLWGVYRFKRGFGGEIKRSVQAVDFLINPLIYAIYRKYPGRSIG